jgi:hypothetical protein
MSTTFQGFGSYQKRQLARKLAEACYRLQARSSSKENSRQKVNSYLCDSARSQASVSVIVFFSPGALSRPSRGQAAAIPTLTRPPSCGPLERSAATQEPVGEKAAAGLSRCGVGRASTVKSDLERGWLGNDETILLQRKHYDFKTDLQPPDQKRNQIRTVREYRG